MLVLTTNMEQKDGGKTKKRLRNGIGNGYQKGFRRSSVLKRSGLYSVDIMFFILVCLERKKYMFQSSLTKKLLNKLATDPSTRVFLLGNKQQKPIGNENATYTTQTHKVCKPMSSF